MSGTTWLSLSVIFVLCILFFPLPSSTYKHYQKEIPNGEIVVHSCKSSLFWNGVGHTADSGGGALNPFGKDFKSNGFKWTEALCRKDSDGDGRTNGDELGDPDCKWKKGQTPSRTSSVTHPGVCEPITSSTCKSKNTWDVCENVNYRCPGVEEPDVLNYTLRFTRTKVPQKTTTYICQAFELPANQTFHLIGTKPEIDNAYVMHHITIFRCESKPSASYFNTPRECSMGPGSCQQIIGIWALGHNGDCYSKDFGILAGGATTSRYLLIQLHWNNPEHKTTYYDASGVTLHLKQNFRPQNGAIMITGQMYLNIPPQSHSYLQNVSCTKECTTEYLKGTRHISMAFVHMHRAGRIAHAGIYRNGVLKHDIISRGTPVDYNKPVRYTFSPTLTMEPGDEVILECYFDNPRLTESIYFGDGTADEMCFVFMAYYPETNFSRCLSYGPVDNCAAILPKYGGTGRIPGKVGDCQLVPFLLVTLPNWLQEIADICLLDIDGCRGGCKEVVIKYLKNVCMVGWPRRYLNYISSYDHPQTTPFRNFRMAIYPCEREIRSESLTISIPRNGTNSTTSRNKTKEALEIGLMALGCGLLSVGLIALVAFGIYKITHSSGKPIDNKVRPDSATSCKSSNSHKSATNADFVEDEPATA